MKGFSRSQLQKLVGKLDRAHVQTREVGGRKRDYIEGWFAISEANAIFGYAGWDRQMMAFERVFETREGRESLCAYLARVRITVRAGEELITREGTGFGAARGHDRAEAHERALKAAETDATKRALMTFGNRFGLGLYDKDQNGVTALPGSTNGTNGTIPQALPAAGAGQTVLSDGFVLRDENNAVLADALSAEGFCSGLRQLIEAATSQLILEGLRGSNQAMLAQLRAQAPQLRSAQGKHFADILEELLQKKLKVLLGPPREGRARPTPQPADDRSTAQAGVVARPGESENAFQPRAIAGRHNGRIEGPPAPPETDHLLPAKAMMPSETDRLPADGPPAAEARSSAQAGQPPVLRGNPQTDADGGAPNTPHPNVLSSSSAEKGQDQIGGAAPLADERAPSRIGQGTAIDKSRLLVATTRRVRSKAHLAFVASQVCLICGGAPCHAHHLTFAQPRGLSLKVSDEFTVPLCVIHHNALHLHGDERTFWRQHRIDPLEVAQTLWAASRDKRTKGNGGGPR